MSTADIFRYDEVLYHTTAQPQTHPNRLATVAWIYGLNAAPVEKCRVLELGCGTGGNIIPMAYALPGSQFLGIDYSEKQVELGQAFVAELGLQNVEIRQGDIRQLGRALGEFDYIVAHGVYAWVTADVQEKLLHVIGQCLAPRGVAFISYTAGPGGHLRNILRDVMRYHDEHGQSATEGTVPRAKEMAKLLRQVKFPVAVPAIFTMPLNMIIEKEDAALFHDHLNDDYHVVYVAELLKAASTVGLQFLGEADPDENSPNINPPEVSETLRQWAGGDRAVLQQYLDYARFQQFRQTLLCRREAAIDANPRPERVRALKFSLSRVRLLDGDWKDPRSTTPVNFKTAAGTITVTRPVTKAVLRVLENVANGLTFDEVLAGCRKLLPDDATLNAEQLAEALLASWFAALVEAHIWQPPVVTPGERPIASPFIRTQVRADMAEVTTLRHILIAVTDPMARMLLVLMDGTRDRQALVNELADHLTSGRLAASPGKVLPTDPAQLREALAKDLNTSLQALAQMAMLVG